MYSDAQAADLYNVLNPWGASDTFYLALAMDASSVLDIGCGTGTMLHRARAAGHTGRLVGVDPDGAALAIARRRADITWVEATAASMPWKRQFDLAVMMNHTFQFLIRDEELRASLAAIRNALADGGRFAFETRNPDVREWETWTPDQPIDVIDSAGSALRISYRVLSVIDDVVTLTETTSDRDGDVLRVDEASLRFLDVETLTGVLIGEGFSIESQQGDWSGGSLGRDNREIITVTRRV